MKKFLGIILALSLLILPSCSDTELEKLKEEYVTVTIEFKEFGEITLHLYPEIAPITVENFVTLAEEGFYDGLIIHRVEKTFVIQGGDPTGTGYGDPSQKTIKGEFADNGVKNPLKHKRGVISMARSKSNNSATSQFFICINDAKNLDGSYAAFGEVVAGMSVVDAIAGVSVDIYKKPLTDVIIESVKIIE